MSDILLMESLKDYVKMEPAKIINSDYVKVRMAQ